jgi:transposase
MSYIKGKDRDQIILFPEVIDDYITEDNQVRFVDKFANNLDMSKFKYAQTKNTGRPPYNPSDLLKLYIYGYLNNIRSSRKLERETHRNIELFWLLEKLQPDFKTIADFRKDNKEAIKGVFKEFTSICKNLKLFGCELIAVDGSKFAAVNSKKRAFTKKTIEKKLVSIDEHIQDYLDELDKNDEEESDIDKPTKEELEEKIKSLKKRKKDYEKLQEELEKSGNTQICLTDPDSRMMRTPGNGRDVCYNVEIAVDEKHNLIVDYEVTNQGNDLNELGNISIKAKETLEVESLEVLADTGHYTNTEIKKCLDNGITPYVLKPPTNNKERGFSKDKFKYDKELDKYICPNNCELSYSRTIKDKKGNYWQQYRGKDCDNCESREKCTKSKRGRIIERWEHEEIMEEMEKRVKENQDKYRKRQSTVEPVFGIIKRDFNQGYFLLKGLPKVDTEFSLSSLVYNIKRAINEVGIKKLMEAMA